MSQSSAGSNSAIIKLTDKDCFFCDKRFENIKAIFGIGNPGQRFVGTRHNAGFDALDLLATNFNKQFDGNSQVLSFQETFSHSNSTRTITFYKPQTFVNCTGELTTKLKNKGLTAEQIMIIYDDLEKAPGFVGFKIGGSAKGHNGVKSAIQSLGFDFWRLTIGIGRPANGEPVDQYVLGKFAPAEREVYMASLEKVVKFFTCAKK